MPSCPWSSNVLRRIAAVKEPCRVRNKQSADITVLAALVAEQHNLNIALEVVARHVLLLYICIVKLYFQVTGIASHMTVTILSQLPASTPFLSRLYRARRPRFQ